MADGPPRLLHALDVKNRSCATCVVWNDHGDTLIGDCPWQGLTTFQQWCSDWFGKEQLNAPLYGAKL